MIDLPDHESVQRVADWIELNLAITGELLSKAAVSAILESRSGEEPPEAFLSGIWRKLAYRESLYRQKYYKVEGPVVESHLTVPAPNEYVACVVLSLFGVQGNTHIPAKLFERLTRKAVESYLAGKAVVFGWPFAELGGDEETAIKHKVGSLAKDLGEKFYETPASHFKDRGLDIVGWIPFDDLRSGQVVVLLQCAAGHNWEDKLPVPIDAWCQYIHWGCNPIRAFAVPCVVDEKDWHEVSRDKGILFDRIRILNLLTGGIKEKELSDELGRWVQGQLSDYTTG